MSKKKSDGAETRVLHATAKTATAAQVRDDEAVRVDGAYNAGYKAGYAQALADNDLEAPEGTSGEG